MCVSVPESLSLNACGGLCTCRTVCFYIIFCSCVCVSQKCVCSHLRLCKYVCAGKQMFCRLFRQTACVSTSALPPFLSPSSWSGDEEGLSKGGRKSDQLTENKADEEINPVARDETETEERKMEVFRTGRRRRDGRKVEETGADMLSPGVLRVLLIHNSPPCQTFIHILTPHGCAQWSSRPSTSPCLSMDTPVVWRSVSPLLFHFGDSCDSPKTPLCFCPALLDATSYSSFEALM